jgi:hypothetical protein
VVEAAPMTRPEGGLDLFVRDSAGDGLPAAQHSLLTPRQFLKTLYPVLKTLHPFLEHSDQGGVQHPAMGAAKRICG